MITLEQVKSLSYGQIIYHVSKKNSDGTAMRARVSGKVKTWKRDASRVHVPVKHGLYESYWIDETNLDLFTLEEPERIKATKEQIHRINKRA